MVPRLSLRQDVPSQGIFIQGKPLYNLPHHPHDFVVHHELNGTDRCCHLELSRTPENIQTGKAHESGQHRAFAHGLFIHSG